MAKCQDDQKGSTAGTARKTAAQSLRRHRREEEKESFVRPAQKHESLENHQKISKIRKSAKSGSSPQKQRPSVKVGFKRKVPITLINLLRMETAF